MLLSWLLLALVSILILALAWTMVLHLFVYRVPYIPTAHSVVDAMIALADLQPNQTVYDLGAGDGRLLLAALGHCPSVRCIGCEVVPTVWLLGWWKTRHGRRSVRFLLRNALKQDVRDADVIFLYVTPILMKPLQEKFDRELKPGTRVISNTFRFADREAMKSMPVSGLGKMIHVYQW